MAGYHGFSKSNNAIEAEKNGRLPLSKWTKAAILAAATECEISGYIVERGSFYYVYKTSRSKDPIFKKKVGSRGTRFWPAVPKAQTVTTAKARKANSDDINLVIEKLNKEILWEIKISMARAAKRTDCARFLRNLYMDNTVSVYISWPTERNHVNYKIRVTWVDGDTDLSQTDREQRRELLEKQKPWILEACKKAVLEEYENYRAAQKKGKARP